MRTLESAWELLAEQVNPLPGVEMKLAEAVGLRLAESPRADIDLPAADVSTMDGYVVRAEDLISGSALPVAFEVPAGVGPQSLPPRAAARIFTGAVIPAGGDTVIPQEEAEVLSDGSVRLCPLPMGSFIRRKGELCTAGTALGAPGDLITLQRVALLGAAGASTVRVTPQPRAAILSTGSELITIEETPGPGKVRDTNGVMLKALAEAAAFRDVTVERVPDERRALRDAFERSSARADLIVASGGVSVGDYDLVPEALGGLGAKTMFHKLSIKPGKPLLAARLGGTWVMGLPGNAVSAFVCWRLFVRPLGEALAGDTSAFAESPEPGILDSPAMNKGDRTLLAPAVFRPGRAEPRVSVLPWKGSHDVFCLARANALAIVDVGAELNAGEQVFCYRLDQAVSRIAAVGQRPSQAASRAENNP
jgi:molybdopterin molybdotransferase